MADDVSSYEIFWTKDEQENDILNDNHHKNNNNNRKVLGSMEGNSQNETRSKLHQVQPQIPEKDVTSPQRKMKKSKHAEKTLKMKEKPSLKDLRPEDKKRVANLIRELAKAGEEKEVAMEQLQVERLEFEHRMKDLHHQVDEISQEREIVQKQYLECQNLLADYQKQLTQEQDKVTKMNHMIKSTPKKHRSKHTSSPPQGVLHKGSPLPTLHRKSPSRYTHPSSIHSASHHIDSYHNHHQPSLNGFPPPPVGLQGVNGNNSYAQMNGYQPLLFHNQPEGYEEMRIPESHNGVPHLNHHNGSLHQHSRSQNINASNSDFEFQPPLSSTHRPSHQHCTKSRHRHREHVNRLYAIHSQELHGKLPSSQPSSSSPDILLSGHSRTHSGEFQPLLPEPDNDSESTSPPPTFQIQDRNDFYPLTFDPESSGRQYNPQEVPPESFRSLTPQHRQKELLKQRELLEDEQAWLRQKLAEQEKLLTLKQAQLTETELLYLKTGDQNCNAPSVNMYTLSRPVGLGVEPPPVQRQPYGPYPSAEAGVVSTNFPPEEFDAFGQPKLLTESMHGLGLGYESNNSEHEWSVSSVNSHSSHKRKSHDGGKHSRRKDSYEVSNRVPSRNQSQYDGHVSFHSASKSKRKHAGSISSSPSTTSTSTMSSKTRHRSKVKHTATSPLYRDANTTVSPRSTLSPRPTLSPGKPEVTRAPSRSSFSRPSSSASSTGYHKLPSRLQGNLSLHSNRQRTSPSNATQHRETLQLTDLIDSLDDSSEMPRTVVSRTHSKPINRTHSKPLNRTLNGSSRGHMMTSPSRGHLMTTPPHYKATPELFSMEDENCTDDHQEESRMLEDVFFVV